MAAKIVGAAPADEVSRRVAELDDGLAAKPANVGLIGAREQATDEGTNGRTLGTFLNAYITGRTDVKIRTTINLDQARKNLVAYFGEAKPLAEITEGDAEDFRRSLLTRLAINTARRHCGRAKQFFAGAVRKRYLTRNPFAELRGVGVKGNPEKLYFVTRGEAQQVLDACPDNQWRLLFALARFGGLRTPSEPLLLKWTDIDWHRGRIRVTSPRTEHHDGKSERIIPLFPELRPILEAAWDEAPEGTEFVITRCRDTNQNLRTQLQRIIAKAGLKGWPKLFHNLRATRETELAGQHPVHVVCDWDWQFAVDRCETRSVRLGRRLHQGHRGDRQADAHSDAATVRKAWKRPARDVGQKRSNPCFAGVFESLQLIAEKGLPPLGLEPRT